MSLPQVSRRLLCCFGAASCLTRAARPVFGPVYLFETADTRIRMRLEYYDNFEPDSLRFRETRGNRVFCASSQGFSEPPCVDSFHGSIAIVHYRLTYRRAPSFPTQLREVVRDVDRSDAVSFRAPFERAIQLQNGEGSDIQAFGRKDREENTHSARRYQDAAWFVLRQDLFLQGAVVPFLVLHWRHQIDAIRVLDLLPGPGTRQVLEPSEEPAKQGSVR